jgi:TetR/AcrR family transcriptional repressor of nem operon
MARSRADISLFDALIDGFRAAGLLPAGKTVSRKP